MSEHIPQHNIDPSVQGEQALQEVQRTLHHEDQILSLDGSMYPAETIGMASVTSRGEHNTIVGTLRIPNDSPDGLNMALIKAVAADGTMRIAVGGMDKGNDGQFRLNGKFVPLFPQSDQELAFGRNSQDPEGGVQVQAQELWNQSYGPNTSRNHVRIAWTEQGLLVSDSSTYGTEVTGNAKVSAEAAPEPEKPVEQTTPSRSIEENAPENAQKQAKQQLEAARDKRVADARESVDSAHEAAQEAAKEDSAQQLQSEQPETPVHQADAMEELRETWQLPEGVTPERALLQIQNTAEHLRHLSGFLSEDSDFTNLLHDLRYDFKDTLDSRHPTYGAADIQTAMDFLGVLRDSLMELNSDRVLLPIRARHSFNDAYNTVNLIGSALQNAAPHAGHDYEQSVFDAQNLLARDDIKDIRSQVAMVRALVEEKQDQLYGYRSPELQEAEKPTAALDKIVHAGMKELATKLQKADLTDEQVADSTATMERYLEDILYNSANSIDANLEFPSRILENSTKTRTGGEKLGQDGRSRRITSEIAVDMLRGTFDIQKSNREDDIQVMADDVVETGQHRAAALMLLYGKDWIKVARQLGFDIKVDGQRGQKRP